MGEGVVFLRIWLINELNKDFLRNHVPVFNKLNCVISMFRIHLLRLNLYINSAVISFQKILTKLPVIMQVIASTEVQPAQTQTHLACSTNFEIVGNKLK